MKMKTKIIITVRQEETPTILTMTTTDHRVEGHQEEAHPEEDRQGALQEITIPGDLEDLECRTDRLEEDHPEEDHPEDHLAAARPETIEIRIAFQ